MAASRGATSRSRSTSSVPCQSESGPLLLRTSICDLQRMALMSAEIDC